MHARCFASKAYQGIEFVGVAGESDFWRANGHGRLDITAISDVLCTKVHRHAHSWDKHVHNIADHTPHHQRINRGRHHYGNAQES